MASKGTYEHSDSNGPKIARHPNKEGKGGVPRHP